MRGSLPGRWLTAHLPFGDMVGTCRGEVVPDAAPLDRSRAYSLGLLIAGVQAGPFTLEIARLKAHSH